MQNKNQLLVLGAGKSTIYLLEYLRDKATTNQWHLKICDLNIEHLGTAFSSHPDVSLQVLDVSDITAVEELISVSKLVISMVPAFMHPEIAKLCLKHEKNLITPSYISPELKAMDEAVKAKGLLFLNEMGVDPGIDHMSAMKVINRLRKQGHQLIEFESYAGGLIAPESDNNPWHYKFTWNARNVVLAGQGTAKFLQDGQIRYIPYHQVFERTDIFDIPEWGRFEGYANRDSLRYLDDYQLDGIKTLYRGTLRRSPFCRGWSQLIKLGLTDDSYVLESSENLSPYSLLRSFLPAHYSSLQEDCYRFLKLEPDSAEMKMIEWLGFFTNDEPIGIKNASPAKLLQAILEEKWMLHPGDKDLVVMVHVFKYLEGSTERELISVMIITGQDRKHTAMAKSVGLPIAFAAEKMWNNEFTMKGVQIPVYPEIYEPILQSLEKVGITFEEQLS